MYNKLGSWVRRIQFTTILASNFVALAVFDLHHVTMNVHQSTH